MLLQLGEPWEIQVTQKSWQAHVHPVHPSFDRCNQCQTGILCKWCTPNLAGLLSFSKRISRALENAIKLWPLQVVPFQGPPISPRPSSEPESSLKNGQHLRSQKVLESCENHDWPVTLGVKKPYGGSSTLSWLLILKGRAIFLGFFSRFLLGFFSRFLVEGRCEEGRKGGRKEGREEGRKEGMGEGSKKK